MTCLTDMSDRLRGPVLSAAIAIMLGACAHQPRPAVGPPLVQPVDNRLQVEDAVGALRLGDVSRARKILQAMAKRDPSDRSVATLLEGLEGDPTKLLGVNAFNYRVEPGDQLTVLAQRFLGNRLKFYLLARYNGLTSDALKAGQVVRIPGVAPPPPPKPRAEPRPAPRNPAASSTTPVASPAPKADPAAAARLRAQALSALDRGSVASAVALLRRAKSYAPDNVLIQRDLARAERLLAAVKARR